MITVMIGRAALFLIALLTMRVSTSVLSPEEFGKLSVIATSTAFFAMFLINPVGMYVNRKLHQWQQLGLIRQKCTLYLAYVLLIAITSIVLLRIAVGLDLIHIGVNVWWLSLLVGASLLFNTINQTAIPSLNLLGHTNSFLLLSVITALISLMFACLLVNTVNDQAEVWQSGIIIGQALVGILGVAVLLKKVHTTNHNRLVMQRQAFRAVLHYALPVSLAAGLSWVQLQSYRYVTEYYLSLSQLGLFVAGYSISAGILAGMESILTTLFQPALYQTADSETAQSRHDAWAHYANAVIPVMLLTTALVCSLSAELCTLLLGSRFQATAQFVAWAALIELARVISNVLSLNAHIHMRTTQLLLPNIMAAIVTVSACITLIAPLGSSGICYSLLAGQLVFLSLQGRQIAEGKCTTLLSTALVSTVFPAICMYLIAEACRHLSHLDGILASIMTIMMTGFTYLFFLFKYPFITTRNKK